MTTVTMIDELIGADAEFGYRFGCDGLTSLNEARSILGGVSTDTVDRLAVENLIRKGKRRGPNGRIVICRRSLMNYIASLEV